MERNRVVRCVLVVVIVLSESLLIVLSSVTNTIVIKKEVREIQMMDLQRMMVDLIKIQEGEMREEIDLIKMIQEGEMREVIEEKKKNDIIKRKNHIETVHVEMVNHIEENVLHIEMKDFMIHIEEIQVAIEVGVMIQGIVAEVEKEDTTTIPLFVENKEKCSSWGSNPRPSRY